MSEISCKDAKKMHENMDYGMPKKKASKKPAKKAGKK